MKGAIARLHTWVGVVVGIQLVVWLGSGLLMGLLDPEAVSGARTRAEQPEVVRLWPSGAVAPQAIVARSTEPVVAIERAWRLDRPFWRVQTAQGWTLADARTGARWQPTVEDVLRVANVDYSGAGQAASPQRWTRAPLEARGHEGPVWQVDFNDQAGTTLYLDARDATVLERRNDTWRVFDFAWMLHIMDYTGREDFNHPLIITFAVAGLWMALTGLWLLGHAIKAGHLRPRWNAQRVAIPVISGAGSRTKEVPGRLGETLLTALARTDQPLPSRCGGGQTCGMCVVRVTGSALVTDGDLRLLTPEERDAGMRLGCALQITKAMSVELIGNGLRVGWQDAKVEETNDHGATLREVILRPADPLAVMQAGSYVLIEIPPYEFDGARWVDRALAPTHVLRMDIGRTLSNPDTLQRAYSPALTPALCDGRLPLLVRLEVDPDEPGMIGRGSAWLFALKPGARVRFMGPFGDFRLKPGPHEKILIGGGAGMAPLRAMLRDALAAGSNTRIHFWYGARRVGDVPYEAELRALAAAHTNFDFHVVYSEDDNAGFGPRWVHDAVHDGLLRTHEALDTCEFYLCGPPPMLFATRELLAGLGVPASQVAFDDFGT